MARQKQNANYLLIFVKNILRNLTKFMVRPQLFIASEF
jgi:hypothetical protein